MNCRLEACVAYSGGLPLRVRLWVCWSNGDVSGTARPSGRAQRTLPTAVRLKVAEKGPPGRACGETRASALIQATDTLPTNGVYRIRPDWACRASPEAGAAPETSPEARSRSFSRSLPLRSQSALRLL
jgi:hypothetical protein